MSSFKEILAEAGLTDEQAADVQGQMAENNIHLSNKENVDDRYEKLKGQQADAAGQLEEANKLIKQLQAGAGDAEAAKQQAAEYLARIEEVPRSKGSRDRRSRCPRPNTSARRPMSPCVMGSYLLTHFSAANLTARYPAWRGLTEASSRGQQLRTRDKS